MWANSRQTCQNMGRDERLYDLLIIYAFAYNRALFIHIR